MKTRTTPGTTAGLATGTWRLDPSRSSVEFHVPNVYGLMTVKGRFDRYEGTLDVSSRPMVSLVVEGDSLDTNNKKRDKHLRSNDFFDLANRPRVRFEADAAEFDGGTLRVRGLLYAGGKHVPLETDATALVDHRQLGMTWSPLGIVRAPSKLIVRGCLVRAEDVR